MCRFNDFRSKLLVAFYVLNHGPLDRRNTELNWVVGLPERFVRFCAIKFRFTQAVNSTCARTLVTILGYPADIRHMNYSDYLLLPMLLRDFTPDILDFIVDVHLQVVFLLLSYNERRLAD